MTNEFHHTPVLLNEMIRAALPTQKLIETLKTNQENTFVIVDATIGGAGHAQEFVNAFFENFGCQDLHLYFIGIDQDLNAVNVSTEKLKALQNKYSRFQYHIFHSNFDQLSKLLKSSFLSRHPKIHGIYADFGVSSPQLDTRERGFSFLQEGPLDMRMDVSNALTAQKVLSDYSENELAKIFFEYGEEPKSRILARAIVKDRTDHKLPLQNTKVFADYVKKILKYGYSRAHPATRIFQALRIEVNNELGSIQIFLNFIPDVMHISSHAAFISFHSLEDRLVKRSMRLWQEKEFGKESPRGGITPTEEEIVKNPRARSARLRVFDFTR